MDISFHTLRVNLNKAIGYGYAGDSVTNSLKELGHVVYYQNPKCPVQLNFTQPYTYKLHKGQYQIGYTPWESTLIPDKWQEGLNAVDEIWTTSNWCKDVFEENGFKNIKVFPHGIKNIWIPKKRIVEDKKPLKFLHIGEPAPRKAGQLVVDTFIKIFGNNPEYHLTVKAHNTSSIRVYDPHSKRERLTSPDIYKNITLITEEYSEEQLVKLYHDHHVLVYPSWGEGFGFIPLQALATGMPTICTAAWAHYKNYLGPLALKSELTDEPLPKTVPHPHIGKMFKPDADHIEEQMVFAAVNFKAMSGYYFSQAEHIHKEYNWLQLTNNAFDHIFKKFS